MLTQDKNIANIQHACCHLCTLEANLRQIFMDWDTKKAEKEAA